MALCHLSHEGQQEEVINISKKDEFVSSSKSSRRRPRLTAGNCSSPLIRLLIFKLSTDGICVRRHDDTPVCGLRLDFSVSVHSRRLYRSLIKKRATASDKFIFFIDLSKPAELALAH